MQKHSCRSHSYIEKVLMARNADGKTGQEDLYKTVENK